MAVSTSDCVVLTRAPEDNAVLRGLLETAGIEVCEVPCLAVRYRFAGEWPSRVDAVAFSSRRGVTGLFRAGVDASWLTGPLLGAVGEATAAQLAEYGFEADVTVEPPLGATLGHELSRRLPRGARVAVVRGNLTTGTLESVLLGEGLEVIPVSVYENVDSQERLRPSSLPRAVFIASPSAAKRLVERAPWITAARFFAIGPTSAQALVALGVTQVEIIGTDTARQARALIDAAQQR